jgi:hypothetical protein
MNYSMIIQGMHCPACKKLITMTMEDLSLTNIEIDETTGVCKFSAGEKGVDITTVVSSLIKELPDYNYSNPELTQ